MTVALYAGSFDPIHLGHLHVIEQLVRMFDEVIVGVVANPNKGDGLFRPEERLQLVSASTAHLTTVRAVASKGLTVHLAQREGASVLIRVADKDRSNEVTMAAMNRLAAGIPTIVVPADPLTRGVSSSLVRELVATGQVAAARELVPPCVGDALAALATR